MRGKLSSSSPQDVHHFLRAAWPISIPGEPPVVRRVSSFNRYSQADHREEDRGWRRELPICQHLCPLSEGKTSLVSQQQIAHCNISIAAPGLQQRGGSEGEIAGGN